MGKKAGEKTDSAGDGRKFPTIYLYLGLPRYTENTSTVSG